ncbi:hypothetical protein CNMCM5878_000574 [Aspergillus fumigatiaffinis]|nr:hypothetical protein CNMCM5878_000574 [Aspergillus fumigatiaffinis]KAF4219464.1 hypothetical protein CNMCM6457_003030 [Aspergillus fumigatiaffinis]
MIIAGDSAGGNLTAALLFHSAHPHPGVERLNLCGRLLGGAFLVSPWVTFKTTSQSMKRNVYGDYVDHDSIRRAAGLFADGMEDTYCAPLTATATSWKGIKVRHLAIVAGEFEIMVDDIIQFAENVKKYNLDAQFHVAAKETHVQMVVSRLLRLPVAESEVFFEQWLYPILN